MCLRTREKVGGVSKAVMCGEFGEEGARSHGPCTRWAGM